MKTKKILEIFDKKYCNRTVPAGLLGVGCRVVLTHIIAVRPLPLDHYYVL